MAARPPTNLEDLFSSPFRLSKIRRSPSSWQKARMTLAPDKFSLVDSSTSSSFACVFLYKGIQIHITAYTTIAKTSMDKANTPAASPSIINAQTSAPNTIKGERKNKRRNKLMPVCILSTSPVIRVRMVASPILSKSL